MRRQNRHQERNLWLARTGELKNKLDNEQELTGCSRPDQETCLGVLENWVLAALEERLAQGSQADQVITAMPEIT